MIEKGNVDRLELSTFYSTIDALAIELHISIYTSIAFKNPYYFHKQCELSFSHSWLNIGNYKKFINFHKLMISMSLKIFINTQITILL